MGDTERSLLREEIETKFESIPQFAKGVGISPEAIYKILNGETSSPKSDTLHSMAHCLGYGYDEFIDNFFPAKSQTSNVKEGSITYQSKKDIDLYDGGKLLTPFSWRCSAKKFKVKTNFKYSIVKEDYVDNKTAPKWKPKDVNVVPKIVIDYFKKKNEERLKDAILDVGSEYSDYPIFRIISEPSEKGLEITPIIWEMFSVHIPYPESSKMQHSKGNYSPDKPLLDGVKLFLKGFPDDKRGLEVLGANGLIITKDNKILMRRKDITTTLSGGYWDCSFGGYAKCNVEYGVDGGKLNITNWAGHELYRETKTSIGYNDEVMILGLHKNTYRSSKNLIEGVNVLVLIKTDIHSDQIASGLAENNRTLMDSYYRTGRMSRSPGAPEKEVQNSGCAFIDFNVEEIKRFIRDCARENRGSEYPQWGILPEAMATLIGALRFKFGNQVVDDIKSVLRNL